MTAWRQGNPPPGNGKVFGVPAPRRDVLRDELQCGQIHGAGTDSVQDQSIFPESVENQPPGEMFDPPGADARILQIGSLPANEGGSFEKPHGLPDRFVPMLGNLRAGLFQQPIDLLGDVFIETGPNKNLHEAAFFDSSNRRRALRKAASNLAWVKGSSGPLSRAS